MRRRGRLVLISSVVSVLAVASSAAAADFSPTTKFTLSDRTTAANPSVSVHVEQDADEEELATVTLTVPAGFKLPTDAAIEDGEVLGEGEILIAMEPLCLPSSFPIHVELFERDRTEEEAANGVKAVWVVDLRPVTTIDLLVRGTAKNGWTLSGDIPSNAVTCPPFSFDATINPTSSDSGTKIFVNPATPGKYLFTATYTGVDGSTYTNRQRVKITG